MTIETTEQRLTDEEGLTLIELIITIAVLSIIIVPIVASFTLALLESSSSRERTADATSAQVISTYLQNDIQSSCLRATPDDPSTDCGDGTVVKDAGTCATDGDVKLELAWRVPKTSPAEDIVVDYYVATTADGQKELHRAQCVNGGSPEDTLLALNLENASVFEATCAPNPDCSGLPTSVSVFVKAESIRVNENSSYSPFEFTFEATRRVGS